MAHQFKFKILDDSSRDQGHPYMKEAVVPYPFRFLSKEKYLYVSRIAYFERKSINETLDGLIFEPRWSQKNEEYKAQQKKLGVSDAEIQSRRKKRLRRWHLKKAA